MPMTVSIKPREITSVQLNNCTTVFGDREVVIGTIGSMRYIIFGDSTTEAKDLPRLPVVDLLVDGKIPVEYLNFTAWTPPDLPVIIE